MPACCCPKSAAETDLKLKSPSPPPEPPPPPEPELTEEEFLMSKLLYPKPGELGIVWGDKVICCIETGLPELVTRCTQTDGTKETQTACPRCGGGGEGPPAVTDSKPPYKPRYFGNVHQMNLIRRLNSST